MRNLKAKLAMLAPVLMAAVFGLVLSNLTMSDTPRAEAGVFDQVERVTVGPQSPKPDDIPTVKGAGFQPQQMANDCPCPCLDEAAIRGIVRDEFDKQMRAEQVAPRASIPGTVGYSTVAPTTTRTVTYSSQPVTYSQQTAQPTTTYVRSGLFGRRVVQVQSSSSGGSCRIVNGRMVCN